MLTVKKDKAGLMFVAVTILWTWGVLAVPVLLRLNIESSLTKVAFALAGASPSVIGLIFAGLTGGSPYIYAVFKRILSFGSANISDYLTAFALVPAVTVLSAYAGLVLIEEVPNWSPLLDRCTDPAGFVLFALFMLVFGPLAEELGWRGYLLDCWEDNGVLVYGVGIGIIWTVWHLPMFFVEGSYQNGLLRQGALPVVYFILSTTALGVIIGRLVKRTCSILTAVVFHFTINFTGELIPLTPFAELFYTAALVTIACGIVFFERQREACHGKE